MQSLCISLGAFTQCINGTWWLLCHVAWTVKNLQTWLTGIATCHIDGWHCHMLHEWLGNMGAKL